LKAEAVLHRPPWKRGINDETSVESRITVPWIRDFEKRQKGVSKTPEIAAQKWQKSLPNLGEYPVGV